MNLRMADGSPVDVFYGGERWLGVLEIRNAVGMGLRLKTGEEDLGRAGSRRGDGRNSHLTWRVLERRADQSESKLIEVGRIGCDGGDNRELAGMNANSEAIKVNQSKSRRVKADKGWIAIGGGSGGPPSAPPSESGGGPPLSDAAASAPTGLAVARPVAPLQSTKRKRVALRSMECMPGRRQSRVPIQRKSNRIKANQT
jgi:hypothetical protein